MSNFRNRNKFDELADEIQGHINQINAQAETERRNLTAQERQTVKALAERLALAQQKAAAYELSGQAAQDEIVSQLTARRAAEREVAQRRAARMERRAQEQAELDRQLSAVTFDVNVPDMRERRRIVKEHLAELEKRRQFAEWIKDEAALNQAIEAAIAQAGGMVSPAQVKASLQRRASLEFESNYTDEFSGRNYVVYSDTEGNVFVDGVYGATSDTGGE